MQKARSILKMLGISTITLCLCAGCASKNTMENELQEVGKTQETTLTQEVQTVESTEEEVPIKEERPKPQEVYHEMIEKSLLSVGDNGRLDVVLQKLQNGEDVVIAAIGGSITEGAGASKQDENYVARFISGLKERYPESDIQVINAGIGGTPSTLGIMRYERDVTQALGQNPDLVLVEFAVNDYQEPTGARAYESLVYTILEKEDKPAVMLVFSVFKSKWNMQDIYIPVGEQYGLPMVSIKDAIAVGYEKGTLADGLFFSDEYHPTSYGHRIMSDCLLYLIDEKAKNVEPTLTDCTTESVYGREFADMHLLTATGEMCADAEDEIRATVEMGGFDATDDMIQRTPHIATSAFPDNWMHTAESSTDAFKVTLECKNILLNFKASNSQDFGKAEVFIDGEYVTELAGYQQGGWNNSNIVLVLDEQESAVHELEIKMAEGSEDKNFTIQCIGYTTGNK